VIFDDPDRNNRIISSVPKVYSADHILVDGALLDVAVVRKAGTPRGDFFMMCEDVEYSKRIKRAGFSISVLEDTEILNRHHHGGGQRFSAGTLWRGYYHSRNHLIILKEYFSFYALLAYIIRQLKYLTASLYARDRVSRIGLRLLGVYHGLIGKMGKQIDPEVINRRYKVSTKS
jgi:rhamnopyranosyl-N-acetylglucosaminyl-diphospho-decaprenol beta-1,3/1,4-galactofuranosyltransferase